MRIELVDDKHPVNELTKSRADDNNLRLETSNKIKAYSKSHSAVIFLDIKI